MLQDHASPLHQAAARGAVGALHALLAAGAAPDAADELGWTPLMLAVRAGRAAAAQALLAAGADLMAANKQQGSNALHLAACNGRPDVVAVLLKHPTAQAAAAARDAAGATPAELAKTPELGAQLAAAARGG